MGLPWAHGTFVVLPWCSHGISMGPWVFCGASMVSTWEFYGTPVGLHSVMGLACTSMGPLWEFHEKSMGLAWGQSLPMGLP